MNHIGKYLLQFALLPFVFCLPAQQSPGQVKVAASANKNIMLQDELIKLQFSVENAEEVQQFIPPAFKGCKVVEGPLHTTGTSVVNGAVNNYVTFMYVIQPEAPGNYALSGGSAKINNQRFVFNTIRFKVKESKHNNNRYNFQSHSYDDVLDQQLYSDYIIRKGEDIQNKIRQNLFIKVDVSKDHCYEGEPVIATYKLYTRLRSESKVSKRPSFNGFSVYDIVDPSSAPSTIETLNGKNFNVYLIRKAQLFPLQSGILELDPAEVENSISFLSAETAMKDKGEHLPELLRSFESDNVTHEGIITENVNIKSNPLPVTVKALPAFSRPESFDGAVGNFSIEASIDKNEIALNDVALLRVIIKGEGNFGVINAPMVQWPKDMEAYEPDIKENVLKTVAPMRGYKTFAFTVMPKRTGIIAIPPVEFSYFDPQANQYKTAKTDAVVIHAVPVVQKNAPGAGTAVTGYESAPTGTGTLWMITAAVLLGLFGFFLFRYIRLPGSAPVLRSVKNGGQETVTSHQKEPQAGFLSNPLFRARLMLVQQNGQGFYSELGKALRNYMNEKLQLTGTYTDQKDIAQRMKVKGFDDIIITQFQLLIQQCEVALYTPVINEAEMQSVYDLAEDLLDNISKA
ncbi:BatD family protein [Agriterribacter sp.]|uniref:BatD family protein n=1 Tax=Agriterribacter sp. TaxID=2821509 RepID=UPI002CAEE068|nr:BatD family protein [Agriterribacter sp.]HRO47813.1 BatD family protein [Agriterribacter sp.]HRQ15880.1 BatD family protein [Agriterribacter sp.]